jgi:hypothetical protein
MLLEQETYSCGTARANRKKTGQQNLETNCLEIEKWRDQENGAVRCDGGKTGRVVLLLSTNSDPRNDGSVTRKIGKGNEEIETACPQAVINYTKRIAVIDTTFYFPKNSIKCSIHKNVVCYPKFQVVMVSDCNF